MSNLRITERARNPGTGSAFDSTNIDSILVEPWAYFTYPISTNDFMHPQAVPMHSHYCCFLRRHELAVIRDFHQRKSMYPLFLTAKVYRELVRISSRRKELAWVECWYQFKLDAYSWLSELIVTALIKRSFSLSVGCQTKQNPFCSRSSGSCQQKQRAES